MNALLSKPGLNANARIAALTLCALIGFGTAGASLANTYTVTNTADTLTAGTLRQTISDANAHANSLNSGGVPDTIAFAITGSGVKTISLTSSLPTRSSSMAIRSQGHHRITLPTASTAH